MSKQEGAAILKNDSPVRIFTCSLSEGEQASSLQSYISCGELQAMVPDTGVWAGHNQGTPAFSLWGTWWFYNQLIMYVWLPTELLGTFGLQSLMEEDFIWENSIYYISFCYLCAPAKSPFHVEIMSSPTYFDLGTSLHTVSINNLQVWSLRNAFCERLAWTVRLAFLFLRMP